jgi:type I restriction enzyme S subunit
MPLIAAEYGVPNQHEVRPWGEIKKGYTHFAEGDVGLAKITPCFENGKSTVFRNLTGGIGSGTTELHIVRPLIVAQDYILLFLKSPYFIESGIAKMTGTAGQKRVPTEYFAHSPFPLPPLAEQHRIVAKVDELMALCDRLEAARAEREAKRDRLAAASLARLNAPDPDPSLFADHARFALDNLAALATRPDQIKQIRQTILNLAVRGKLLPQDAKDKSAAEWLHGLTERAQGKKSKPVALRPLQNFEASYSLASSWCWMELGKLVTVMDAGWSPQCESHPRSDFSKWGVLKTTAVQTLSFDCGQNKELPSKFQPRPQHEAQVDDILVTRAGPKNRVGVSCVVDKTEPRLMISDKLIRFRLIDGLSPRFFALALNAGVSNEAVEAAKSGMAVMQMNISQDKLRAVPVPLPPLAEQHRIVKKVDALMAICVQLEASLTAAETTRRRLLEALLAEALAPAEAQDMEAAQ